MQRPATRGVAMTALLSLLAILTFAAPAGVAASGPCKAPRSAKTIASDGGSKAWRVTTDGGPGAPDIREYFACKSLRHPFRFEKGDTGADSLLDVPSAAIRGRFLAYGRIRMHGLGTSRARVIVRDLRTHKTTFARRAVSKQQGSSASTTSSCAAAEASRGSRRTSSVAKASACLRSGSTRRADRNGSIRARTSPGARYG